MSDPSGSFSCYLIGGDSLLVQCAEILIARHHAIRGVVTNAPEIRNWSRRQGLPCLADDARTVDALRSDRFDYLFSITHLAVIPEPMLACPTRSAINFHDGPLPRYAGLNTPAWALIEGAEEYGITWHRMTAGVDEGDILLERRFPIADDETSLTLNTKCYEHGIESFAELVDQLASDTTSARPQDATAIRHYRRSDRPPDAGAIDWTQPATTLARFVRALDFGANYANPIGMSYIFAGERLLVVRRAEARETLPDAAPGTIVGLSATSIDVATGDGTLALTEVADTSGQPMNLGEAVRQLQLKPGGSFSSHTSEERERFTRFHGDVAKAEPFWKRQLATKAAFDWPLPSTLKATGDATAIDVEVEFDRGDDTLFATALFLSQLAGSERFDARYRHRDLTRALDGLPNLYAASVPLTLRLSADLTIDALRARVDKRVRTIERKRTHTLDLIARTPSLRTASLAPDSLTIARVDELMAGNIAANSPDDKSLVTIEIADQGRCRWYTAASLAPALTAIARRFESFCKQLEGKCGDRRVADLELVFEPERTRLVETWNATTISIDDQATFASQFIQTATSHADAVAVIDGETRLTYRELDERSNTLAHTLRESGVNDGEFVGVCLVRSIDMLVTLLAIAKTGAAYVPLDPDYPSERLEFMVADSGLSVVVSHEPCRHVVPGAVPRVLELENVAFDATSEPIDRSRAHGLAYMIYTSGSTGKPKGVMVEHQNAVNFFAGMDERIPHRAGARFLAVTSLSFDISVLELLWTLTRGLEVVLYRGEHDGTAPSIPASDREIDFSLFYFSSDASQEGDKYRLLLGGAEFADAHAFNAVWTPERHFHAFGGLYPNAAVTSAAIAVKTKHVQIRSGSVVLPLHHPARIAEDWSVVDNLSQGRVGLSIAAGWQPNDFILRPENFENRKDAMFRDIEIVKKLWRGEQVEFPNGDRAPVTVSTLPRPIQPELPIWITVAGNPETYRQAGEIGANVLTHLLGQSVDELASKIRIYREARRAAGHGGDGIVSLMLHTFVCEDEEFARQTVEEPLKEYLKSAMHLVKAAAWSFPTFKTKIEGSDADNFFDNLELDDEDFAALLDHAFHRYYESSGLFGTPESCRERVTELQHLGVDEIACLVDFGIPTEIALEHLDSLARLLRETKQRVARARRQSSWLAGPSRSLAELVDEHAITHLQCTPSMANMFWQDPDNRAALTQLELLLVGGEAISGAFASELATALAAGKNRGRLLNMYGPTETTIWSSTAGLSVDGHVTIGRPIANTTFYVLDPARRLVPTGAAGELYIGGAGVTRGYWQRPELTRERFVDDPFSTTPDARLYRTGDRVRYLENGDIEYLGRLDFQVKVRGYRIELGEIESRLLELHNIAEAVVAARQDEPGDARLVAYLIAAKRGTTRSAAELREAIGTRLPAYMVPNHFIWLDSYPLTPNGKVDRNALPAPTTEASAGAAATTVFEAPSDELEQKVAATWQYYLQRERIGIDDNFFDLGGHSLLAVKLHRELREGVAPDLRITDLFRFPTIRTLCQHIKHADDGAALASTQKRAESRRDAMQKRRELRKVRRR